MRSVLTRKLAGVIILWAFTVSVATAAAAVKEDTSYGRHSRELTLTSKKGRHYRIQVSVPDAAPPKDGYPVLYVLDGNGWFEPAAGIMRMREYEKLSPTIVVGIAAANRSFFDNSRAYDFTPPGSVEPEFEGIPLGGADEFLAFLDDTVKPWVSAHYHVDAHRRILFGHSMGGSFALHALFKSPGSFDVYLAASPDIGFGTEIVPKEEPAFESDPRRKLPRLLVTVGSLEQGPSPALEDDYRRWYAAHPEEIPGMTPDQAVAELFADGGGYDKIGKTRALVEKLKQSGVAAEFVEFDGDEHMAAAIGALNRGIPFALRPPASKN